MTQLTHGAMVNDKIRLCEPLGQGGMGHLWVADHLMLQAKVAVKFISIDRLDGDLDAVARFMREASMSAQIPSPHVVRTFDHGITDEGLPYIVMELLRGRTLRERLKEDGALSRSEASTAIRQVCKALASAHKMGIVHRDIKPDNVFILEEDDDASFGDPMFVKVLDFGLAKQTHPLEYGLETSTGAMVGTPSYMSPEQALSKKAVDHRADLWAVSVLAYHAVTGRLPFRGETLGSLCVAIANSDYVAATTVHAGLPAAFDAFFDKALHPDIDQRFQSAKELATAFVKAANAQQDTDTSPAPLPIDVEAMPSLAGGSVARAITSVIPPPRRTGLWLAAAAATALALGVVAARTDQPSASPGSDPAPAASTAAEPAPEPSSAPEVAPSSTSVPETKPETKAPQPEDAAPPKQRAAKRRQNPAQKAPPPKSAPAAPDPPAGDGKERNWGF